MFSIEVIADQYFADFETLLHELGLLALGVLVNEAGSMKRADRLSRDSQ